MSRRDKLGFLAADLDGGIGQFFDRAPNPETASKAPQESRSMNACRDKLAVGRFPVDHDEVAGL